MVFSHAPDLSLKPLLAPKTTIHNAARYGRPDKVEETVIEGSATKRTRNDSTGWHMDITSPFVGLGCASGWIPDLTQYGVEPNPGPGKAKHPKSHKGEHRGALQKAENAKINRTIARLSENPTHHDAVRHVSWMRHHSHHDPFTSFPAPGVVSRECAMVKTTLIGVLPPGKITGLMWSPSLCSKDLVVWKSKAATSALNVSPVITLSADNTTALLAAGAGNPEGTLPNSACHTQYVGAELEIQGAGTLLNSGGYGIVLDGRSNSGIGHINYGVATPSFQWPSFDMLNTPSRTAGAFVPGNKTQLFRFTPHGAHIQDWVENPVDWTEFDAKARDLMQDSTIGGNQAHNTAEYGYTQGILIDNAESSTPIRFHLTTYSRVLVKPPGLHSNTVSRLPTTIAPANPDKLSKISTAAAQLSKIARDSGTALTTTHANPSNGSKDDSLLNMIENGAVAGTVVGAATKYVPRLIGGAERMAGKFITGAVQDLTDVVGGAALLL